MKLIFILTIVNGFGQFGLKFFSVFHTISSSSSKSLKESVAVIIRFLCIKTPQFKTAK